MTFSHHDAGLVLAADNDLPYRVLRCVSDAGLKTHVLGISGSKASILATSRFCSSYHTIPRQALLTGAAVQDVNALIRQLRIRLVIPSDPVSTVFLGRFGAGLLADVFPVPGHEAFENLHAKNSFAQL